jgi:glyoxylase-like metal-dependent hydrolase (beta-lactamase superfamily II)
LFEINFEIRKNATLATMKKQQIRRRRLVQGLALTGTLSAFGIPLSLLAQDGLVTHMLTDRITLVSGAGSNVVLFRGNDGITVVDSGSAAMANALARTIRDFAGAAPVTTLFNTHWHQDHTGGNEAICEMGAHIVAHENTRLWLTADFDVEWRNTSHSPRPETALPDITFYESGAKDLGGETVQYFHYEQAHTDGDIALFFPDSNVLVAGGLMSDGTYPITDIATGGWIGGLIQANAAMLALANDATVIVPENGPARTKAELQAQYDMLSDLYATMKALVQDGLTGQNMLDRGITAPYDATWGDPTEFLLETYRGMWAHTSDMGGFI